jgi:hypothetical protein
LKTPAWLGWRTLTEDLFCELIVSEHGSFRVFSGQWESAGAYTQTLLDAFESLPEAEVKSQTLASAYSLLRLSDEVAARAGVDRDTLSGGTPMANIELPSPVALRQLADRVRFTDADLKQIAVIKEALTPYILDPDHFPHVSERLIGDTPLEFHPLLRTPSDLILVSPANVSLAVRSVLIMTALRGGMGDAFQEAILERQEQYSESGHFWPVRPVLLSSPDRFFIRISVGTYEPGGDTFRSFRFRTHSKIFHAKHLDPYVPSRLMPSNSSQHSLSCSGISQASKKTFGRPPLSCWRAGGVGGNRSHLRSTITRPPPTGSCSW